MRKETDPELFGGEGFCDLRMWRTEVGRWIIMRYRFHWCALGRLVYLGVVRLGQGLHEGVPVLLAIDNVVAQPGYHRAVISLVCPFVYGCYVDVGTCFMQRLVRACWRYRAMSCGPLSNSR